MLHCYQGLFLYNITVVNYNLLSTQEFFDSFSLHEETCDLDLSVEIAWQVCITKDTVGGVGEGEGERQMNIYFIFLSW